MKNCLPVCLTYVLWPSGQVSLYTFDREYLLCSRCLCVSGLANVCVVRNVILRSVHLKMFVMYEVSLPIYVKLAHFCVVWIVICLSGLGVGSLCSFFYIITKQIYFTHKNQIVVQHNGLTMGARPLV